MHGCIGSWVGLFGSTRSGGPAALIPLNAAGLGADSDCAQLLRGARALRHVPRKQAGARRPGSCAAPQRQSVKDMVAADLAPCAGRRCPHDCRQSQRVLAAPALPVKAIWHRCERRPCTACNWRPYVGQRTEDRAGKAYCEIVKA